MAARVPVVVGVSDAKASGQPEHTLVTYSLGSCIGVTLYDPITHIGGMLHYQLPSSSADPQRAAEKPLMFADTGMAWLLNKMTAMGANKKRLRVRMAGAAQMLDDNKLFDIGRRNHASIRKILFSHGLFIDSEHVGGKIPRTLHLNVADGSVTIKSNNEVISL
ncbi:MAG: chemotaxis protein CheD [Tepidisphaeraceae bacterium]